METIKFSVDRIATNTYRIVSRDIRTMYKQYNTGCISEINVLFECMKEIKRDIENKFDNTVVFDICDFTTE